MLVQRATADKQIRQFKVCQCTFPLNPKLMKTKAFARTTQLNDDFEDLNGRLDQLEAHADEVLRVLRTDFGPAKKVHV